MTIEEKVIEWGRDRELIGLGKSPGVALYFCAAMADYFGAKGTDKDIAKIVGKLKIALILLREQLPEQSEYQFEFPDGMPSWIAAIFVCAEISKCHAIKKHVDEFEKVIESVIAEEIRFLRGITRDDCLRLACESMGIK